MVSNMHCRTSYPTNDSPYSSSFLFIRSPYTNNLNHCTYSTLSNHDQIPLTTRTCRRRLEDPIITYASNYYATYSHQTLHSPPPSPQSPSLSSRHRLYPKSNDKDIFCDLYNLLERPLAPVKQRRKHILSDYNIRSRHRSTDYKNTHVKVKNDNEQKRHYQKQPQQLSSYRPFKKSSIDKLSLAQHYDRSQEACKSSNRTYQRHSSSKGFLRRIVCNYFCMPMTDIDEEGSS